MSERIPGIRDEFRRQAGLGPYQPRPQSGNVARQPAPSEPDPSMTPIGEGRSFDNNVLMLQESLNDMGHDVVEDGIWGPQTEQAVMSFQEGYGMEPTGQVSDNLFEAIVDMALQHRMNAF